MAIVTTAEAEKVMKRCQIGTRNYDEANSLHAECYGTIGALVQERDMLRTGDTCARHCEGAAYRIELRRLRDCAGRVIAAFEVLGRTNDAAGLLTARARCESVMLELQSVLPPNAEVRGATPIGGASLSTAGLEPGAGKGE